MLLGYHIYISQNEDCLIVRRNEENWELQIMKVVGNDDILGQLEYFVFPESEISCYLNMSWSSSKRELFNVEHHRQTLRLEQNTLFLNTLLSGWPARRQDPCITNPTVPRAAVNKSWKIGLAKFFSHIWSSWRHRDTSRSYSKQRKAKAANTASKPRKMAKAKFWLPAPIIIVLTHAELEEGVKGIWVLVISTSTRYL